MFKLLILDIDGVLNDGKKYYDLNGHTFAKQFSDKDFTAIKRFRASGINVCLLSGDNKVNESMANNRNIDFYYSRGKNSLSKPEHIPLFEKKYNVTSDEMAYVGDDFFDIEVMKCVKFRYCPQDSPDCVKEICDIIPKNGGDNVICELYDDLIRKKLINECSSEDVYNLDKKENF